MFVLCVFGEFCVTKLIPDYSAGSFAVSSSRVAVSSSRAEMFFIAVIFGDVNINKRNLFPKPGFMSEL